MTEPRDELLERYAEAVAQDPRRPSDRVRNAARAHAQMLRDQAAQVKRAHYAAPTKPAANQPQWTLSLVASLAVVGLAGLLYVQIDRGAPQDREIALGAPAPSHVPSPSPSPSSNSAQSARTDTAQASPPRPTAPAAQARQRSQPEVILAAPSAPIPTVQDAAQAVANATPPRVYSAVPAEADSHPAAKMPSKATGQIASADSGRDAELQTRAESATRASAQFLHAARVGNIATIHKLLAQGVAVDARDDGGNTSLMLAVTHRQAQVVRKLLDSGADASLVNASGLTALQLAKQQGFADIVQLLLPP